MRCERSEWAMAVIRSGTDFEIQTQDAGWGSRDHWM